MISFREQVAVITGAGRGLGKAYALALAARGARVVVNDPGVELSGLGGTPQVADAVVREIEAAGGTAVASYDSVASDAGACAIVSTAQQHFGGIDILINNAGTSQMQPFDTLSLEDFHRLLDVHLFGSVRMTRAVWPQMKSRNYGRVVMTASSAGLWGLENAAAYCAAKAGVIGLAKGLAHEVAGQNIRVNVVAPGARTRMSEGLFAGQSGWTWRPQLVAPAVLYLSSAQCRHNGAVFSALAGHFARVESLQGPGCQFDPRTELAVEDFIGALAQIDDLTGARPQEHALSPAVRQTGRKARGTVPPPEN